MNRFHDEIDRKKSLEEQSHNSESKNWDCENTEKELTFEEALEKDNERTDKLVNLIAGIIVKEALRKAYEKRNSLPEI